MCCAHTSNRRAASTRRVPGRGLGCGLASKQLAQQRVHAPESAISQRAGVCERMRVVAKPPDVQTERLCGGEQTLLFLFGATAAQGQNEGFFNRKTQRVTFIEPRRAISNSKSSERFLMRSPLYSDSFDNNFRSQLDDLSFGFFEKIHKRNNKLSKSS